MSTNIYVLLDPDRKCHGYIGKADDPKGRYISHLSKARKGSQLYVHRWIRKIWKTDKQPIMVVQHWDVKSEDWIKLEKQTIKLYKMLGWNLKNLTDGGDGVSLRGKKHRMFGKKHSEETKQKISQSHKGMLASEKTKQKMSESRIGNTNCVGYKHTDSARQNMSEGQKGRKHSEETKQKMSMSQKGHKNPSTKLNEQQVRVIRALKTLKNPPTQKETGDFFDIDHACVSAIQLRKTWKHVN